MNATRPNTLLAFAKVEVGHTGSEPVIDPLTLNEPVSGQLSATNINKWYSIKLGNTNAFVVFKHPRADSSDESEVRAEIFKFAASNSDIHGSGMAHGDGAGFPIGPYQSSEETVYIVVNNADDPGVSEVYTLAVYDEETLEGLLAAAAQ